MDSSQVSSSYLPYDPSRSHSMGYAPERPIKTQNKKQAFGIKASSSPTGSAFVDNLDSYNTTLWEESNWANGVPFNCGFTPNHINPQ